MEGKMISEISFPGRSEAISILCFSSAALRKQNLVLCDDLIRKRTLKPGR